MLDLRALVGPNVPRIAHITPELRNDIKNALEKKLRDENAKHEKGTMVSHKPCPIPSKAWSEKNENFPFSLLV